MIGPIGLEEFDDRQTDRQIDDRRQIDKSNSSVPYDTFACFAGLIIKIVIIMIMIIIIIIMIIIKILMIMKMMIIIIVMIK